MTTPHQTPNLKKPPRRPPPKPPKPTTEVTTEPVETPILRKQRTTPTVEEKLPDSSVTTMLSDLGVIVSEVDDGNRHDVPAEVVTQMKRLSAETGPLSSTDQREATQLFATYALKGIPGTEPAPVITSPPPVVRPGIQLDGNQLPDLTIGQINTIKKGVKGGAIPQGYAPEIMRRLIATGTFSGSTENLQEAITKTIAAFGALQSDKDAPADEPFRTIAAQMIADLGGEGLVVKAIAAAGINVKSILGIPGDQAVAIDRFLTANPAYLKNLKQYLPNGFEFGDGQETKGSGGAMNWGGGVFINGSVRMALMDTPTPESFLRLVVHETGHASFQVALVGKAQLPKDLDEGTLPGLANQLLGMVTAPAPPTNKRFGFHAELDPTNPIAQIGQVVRAVMPGKQRYQGWPPDAQNFYKAWLTLRANAGQYLLGVDLGPARRPADRQAYQAGHFSEFCAETFMHAAMGDLDSHISGLAHDANVPAPVNQAWTTVRDIVQRYALPIIHN